MTAFVGAVVELVVDPTGLNFDGRGVLSVPIMKSKGFTEADLTDVDGEEGMIIFNKSTNKPILVIGSAGGSRIIGHVTQRLIDILYYKSTLKDAIYSSHLLSQGSVIESESITNVTRSLERKGHKIEVKNLLSALNGIHFDDSNVIVGVSDPRREGLAIGR